MKNLLKKMRVMIESVLNFLQKRQNGRNMYHLEFASVILILGCDGANYVFKCSIKVFYVLLRFPNSAFDFTEFFFPNPENLSET